MSFNPTSRFNMTSSPRAPLSRARRLALGLAAAILSTGAAVPAADSLAADSPAMFEAVRQADLQLATIGWRLAAANAALCDRQEPGTGIQIHTLDQFDSGTRSAAKEHFGFATEAAVEGVVGGSPADQAGVKPDDSLVRVGPIEVAAVAGKAGTTQRLVALQLAIAALPVSAPMEIDVLRRGQPVHLTLNPVPSCRSRFELLLGDGYHASADGTMVQIGSRFIEDYPQEQAAIVVAHEFAHNILHHRDRLEARGVNWGLLSGFGGNVKYFRQTELQADLLSAYLLTNAGYPPRAALVFWRKFGPSKAGGIFRSRSHPAWRDRVATLEAEIGRIEANPARPLVPDLIAQRDQPLTGDWQSILVRH